MFRITKTVSIEKNSTAKVTSSGAKANNKEQFFQNNKSLIEKIPIQKLQPKDNQ